MGSPPEVAYPESWHAIKPVFDLAESSKKAVDVVEIPLTVERSGFVEEAYFTGNFNPLRGDTGRVEGFCNSLVEVTRQKINDRRKTMLNLLSTPTNSHTTDDMSTRFMNCLKTNSLDIPMALLYGSEEDAAPEDTHFTLRGSIGVPPDHPLNVKRLHLGSEDGIVPLLRKSQEESITVATPDYFKGVEWGGHKEVPEFISVTSISSDKRLYGFLIIGTNPRRPIDDDHTQFMRDLARQLSTILITVSREESRKRQQRLEKELAESEKQIRYMAQHSSVGMEHLTMERKIIWVNDHFKYLTSMPSDDAQGKHSPVLESAYEADRPKLLEAWDKIVSGETINIEVRMRRLYYPPSGEPVPATILVSTFPYIEDGKVKSVMTCMTDVSRLKWSEEWHTKVAEEAQEAKRQQSEFTDAISHEVRNPLSAIFQLSDSISNSLDECMAQGGTPEHAMEALADNVEAAKTILVCANHQKRILDDVLTLSKMDFMLMSLSPVEVRPADLLDGVSKMLGPELVSNDIKLEMIRFDSPGTLDFDWVVCDSLRVSQVLVNIWSNAIKFTKRETIRKITVRFGPTRKDPKNLLPQDMHWAPSKQSVPDVTLDTEWGTGEQIYLVFSIQDTGAGMNDGELRRMFNKFEQASPKTHVKYGGSGLGLFISHRLCEQQGGNVGVSSSAGNGSTFACYFKVRQKDGGAISAPGPLSPQRTNGQLDITRDMAHLKGTGQKRRRTQPSISSFSLLDTKKPDALINVHEIPDTLNILLVEDNLVNQRIVAKQLKKAGCIVHIANHGMEALEVLRTSRLWRDQASTGIQLDVVLMVSPSSLIRGL